MAVITQTRLWLSLRFTHLALDQLCRGLLAEQAAAVTVRRQGCAYLWQQNESARAAGLRPGMALDAALRHAPELYHHAHDPDDEQRALERLAGWSGRFAEGLCLEPPRALLLDVGRSAEGFGGLDNLCREIENGLAELGYRVVQAAAPTPSAASLFARTGRAVRAIDASMAARFLAELPIADIPLPERDRGSLDALGVRYLGDLPKLAPERGVRVHDRGLSDKLIEWLDKLYGKRADPRPRYQAPPVFRSRLALPTPLTNAEQLLFTGNRLLKELEGFLRARDQGVQMFRFMLHHQSREPTPISIGLVQPTRDARHWLSLVRERLSAQRLPAAVTALEVRAKSLLPMASLRRGPAPAPNAQTDTDCLTDCLTGAAFPILPSARPSETLRPLALQTTPLPLPSGPPPVWSLQGPERVAADWRGEEPAARDYYIASTPDGKRLWIFQERQGQRRWFMQGSFA